MYFVCFSGVMRFIGRNFDDEAVQSGMKYWPFELIKDKNGKLKVEVEYKGKKKALFPEQILAMMLTNMKQTAGTYLDTTVTDAVITVPTYFNLVQRRAVKDSAAIAGLCVKRVLNQESAAALTHFFVNDRQLKKVRHIIAYFKTVVLDICLRWWKNREASR